MKSFVSLVSAFAVSAVVTGTVAAGALLLATPSRSLARKTPLAFNAKNFPKFFAADHCAAPVLTTTEKTIIERQINAGGGGTVSIDAIPRFEPRTPFAVAAPLRDARVVPIAVNVVNIPVYFHVIEGGVSIVTEDDSTSKITDARIHQQIDILNDAFGGKMVKKPNQIPSEQATSPTRFRFNLRGIDRTGVKEWQELSVIEDGEEIFNMKSSLRRGGPEALNIYTTSIYIEEPGDGLLGFATFPFSYKSLPGNDGVVSHFDSVPGGAYDGYNNGTTTIHEVGHWMGLFHTHQDNQSEEPCVVDNDFVADTPNQNQVSQPDPLLPRTLVDSCSGRRYPGRDAAANFMSYTTGTYQFQFSTGQAKRMSVIGSQFRNY